MKLKTETLVLSYNTCQFNELIDKFDSVYDSGSEFSDEFDITADNLRAIIGNNLHKK